MVPVGDHDLKGRFLLLGQKPETTDPESDIYFKFILKGLNDLY